MLIAWCVLQMGAVTAGFADPVRHSLLPLRPVEVVATPDLPGETLRKLRDLRESPDDRERRIGELERELAAIYEDIEFLSGFPDSMQKTRMLAELHSRAAVIRSHLQRGGPTIPVVPRTPPKVRD